MKRERERARERERRDGRERKDVTRANEVEGAATRGDEDDKGAEGNDERTSRTEQN